jgi:hypothetical protein
MPRKYSEFDFDVDTYEDEPNGMFDCLRDSMDFCPECNYEGPLTLKKRGYVCPECKTLILAHK